MIDLGGAAAGGEGGRAGEPGGVTLCDLVEGGSPLALASFGSWGSGLGDNLSSKLGALGMGILDGTSPSGLGASDGGIGSLGFGGGEETSKPKALLGGAPALFSSLVSCLGFSVSYSVMH